MKRNLMQEKFEAHFEPPEQKHEWASPASARRKQGAEAYAVELTRVRGGLNCLPPGDNIGDAAYFPPTETNEFVMSGESDVSRDHNPSAVANGFKRLEMSPVEDQETNEHNIPFYDEAKVDGDVGFAERNNVLDRQ